MALGIKFCVQYDFVYSTILHGIRQKFVEKCLQFVPYPEAEAPISVTTIIRC